MPRTITQTQKAAPSERLGLVSLVKGLLTAYVITIPAFMLFALILANTDFPSKLISPAVVVTTIISVLTAGLISTKGVKTRGWLNGSIVGLVYMVVLYCFSSLIYNNFLIDRYVITMTAIGVLTGAIGGIIGINTKKSSRYRYSSGNKISGML